ncbi:MAG: hypothetical protein IPJ16_05955 [Bacteroidales bacterium]|nr:hypothetical protein [Bacteroidales bacterium]
MMAVNPFNYLQAVTEVSRLRLILSPPAPTIGATDYCFNSVPATLDATGTTGTLKWWTDAAMTTPAGGAADPYTHGKSAVGSYPFWVNETLGTGCAGPALPVTLVINPLPTITSTGIAAAVCFSAGAQTTTMPYTATTNSPTSYSINWVTLADQGNTAQAFNAGAGTISNINIPAGTAAGTYTGTMTITNSNGCTATQAISLTVRTTPTITSTGTVAPVCITAGAQTTTMPYTATTNSPTSYSIDWATLTDQGSTAYVFLGGGGNVPNISVPAGTAAGTYPGTMTITSANGCTNTKAISLTVNPLPTITSTGTVAPVCFSAGAQTTTMPYTATTNSPTSYSINWTTLADQGSTAYAFVGGGGNVPNIAVPAGTAAGTYTGTMTVTNANGCTTTQAVSLTVLTTPTITSTGTVAPVCITAGAQTTTMPYTATTNSPTSYSIDWATLTDQGVQLMYS